MSIANETNIYYWSVIVYILGALGICVLMLLCSFVLGERSSANSKNIPFESGINSFGTARTPLSAKFYLVAMFFVIFDVEALYLYTWAIAIRETGWAGLIEVTIYIFVLLISLLYLVRIGALSWTSKCSKVFS